MKANISRDNHRPDKRYSGVFQVQGGMVTDADLGEQAQIARARADNLGHDTAGSGVPVHDGAVGLETGGAKLREGVVYAEGVRGEVRAEEPVGDEPLALYASQVDFPEAPDLPEQIPLVIYADLWERTITALEDPGLTDPGLHGAETAFRTQTMAQIKYAPAEMVEQIGDPEGPFPPIGAGTLSVEPSDPETIADDCDPCADTVMAEQMVANALFRLEVVHVMGDAHRPDKITLAWSDENAAPVAPSTVQAEDFSRAGSVYEYFSRTTACHLGAHAEPDKIERSVFTPALDVNEAEKWPYVRRWSGSAEISFEDEAVKLLGSGASVSLDGGRITLALESFTARLDLKDKPVLAGDYWLVELRRFAPEPIRLLSETPMGIRHRYCVLFRAESGVPGELTDEEVRRLSFPALSDLPADHVGFENTCPSRFGDADNVQEALDRLCEIPAGTVSFDPQTCPDLFDGADNVQDALANLCKVDFGTDHSLHLFHDWGVVCGVIPHLAERHGTRVGYNGGWILDRAGTLGKVEKWEGDLTALIGTDAFHFESKEAFHEALVEGEVCLALAVARGGQIERHLVHKDRAFGPRQETFLQVLERCRREKPPFDFERIKLEDVTAPEVDIPLDELVDTIHLTAAQPEFAHDRGFKAKEAKAARHYTDKLAEDYKRHVSDEALAEKIETGVKDIRKHYESVSEPGMSRVTRNLQAEAQVYRFLREKEAERLQACLCNAMLPRCPELGEPPYLVPIACLHGSFDEIIYLRDVCATGCRKQSVSWRMLDYYGAEMRERWMGKLAEDCCKREKKEEPSSPFPPRKPKIDPGFLAKELDPDAVYREIEKSIGILTGRRPPITYKVNPDIRALGEDAAKSVLAGYGVEIGETVDLADRGAIGKLKKAAVDVKPSDLVLDPDTLQPGDRVALLTRGGEARGYVKLERGRGRLPFETPAEVAKPPASGPPLPDSAVEEAEEKIARLEERAGKAAHTAEDAAAKLSGVKEERDRLLNEIDKAKQELDVTLQRRRSFADSLQEVRDELGALESRRSSLHNEIGSAETRLSQVHDRRETLNTKIVEMRHTLSEIETKRDMAKETLTEVRSLTETIRKNQEDLLSEARREHEELLKTMRMETPISAVTGRDVRMNSALMRRGVTNLAELAELGDEDLRKITEEARVDEPELKNLRERAKDRLRGPRLR